MKLVTQSQHLANCFGLERAVDILAECGFDGIDFSAFNEEYYTDAHPASFYTDLRARAEAKGVPFVQAHAPERGHPITKTEFSLRRKRRIPSPFLPLRAGPYAP